MPIWNMHETGTTPFNLDASSYSADEQTKVKKLVELLSKIKQVNINTSKNASSAEDTERSIGVVEIIDRLMPQLTRPGQSYRNVRRGVDSVINTLSSRNVGPRMDGWRKILEAVYTFANVDAQQGLDLLDQEL